MKALLVVLYLLPLTVAAQRYVLVDRKFKEPFTISDTVTLDHMAKGAFPVFREDLPAVIDQLKVFAKKLTDGKQETGKGDMLERKHTVMFLSSKANIYRCVLDFKNEYLSVPLVIGTGNRRATLHKVNLFLEYLRQNKAALGEEVAGTTKGL